MKFDLSFMKEKTNQFWEAYFQALELLDSDRGKRIREVPVAREIPIDENYIFRIGRIRSAWDLTYLPTGSTIVVNEMDDCTRAMELLKTYIDDIVYLYEENS